MLKIGLIGAGSMGGVHNSCYAALSRTHDVAVIAAADLRPEMLEQAAKLWPKAALYRSGMELLEKERPDAVDICLPTYLHAGHALKAMEKGCDVFIEKPLCLSVKDADMLLETQKKHNSRVMIGHVLRFMPEYRFLKEAKESGEYGELQSLVMQRIMGRADNSGGWDKWFLDSERSGSVIVDLHIHDADFARWVLGEPKGFKLGARKNAGGFFEQMIAIFDYGEKMVSAEACWDYKQGFPFVMSYRAGFEKATMVYDSSLDPKLKVFNAGGEKIIPPLFEHREEELRNLTGYYDELQYFIEQCTAKKPIAHCTLEEGVKTIKLVLSEFSEAQRS